MTRHQQRLRSAYVTTCSPNHNIKLLLFFVISVCQYACHVSCTDQAPPVCPIPHSQSKHFLLVGLLERHFDQESLRSVARNVQPFS